MSRSQDVVKMLALLGVAGAICGLTPSCRDNNETVFIRQIQLPAQPDCVTKPDPTAEFIPRGLLDVALSTRYTAFVLVGNQLVARGDFKQARAEPNRIIIKGADIHLLQFTTGGSSELGFFSVNAAGEVDPQSNGDATYGIAGLELIPPSMGVTIQKTLFAAVNSGLNVVQSYEARFKIYGTTLGGTDVETGEYAFDIDVCFGCTIIYPSDAFDATQAPAGVNCKKGGTVSSTTTGGAVPACIVGQDGVTDCRLCQGNPVCTPCRSSADCATAGTPGNCINSHCIPTTI
jgi:hypothetical protein